MVLGLDGAAVDAKVMEGFPDFGGDRHEVVRARGEDVHGGDELVLGELPYVQLVQGDNAVDGEDGVFDFVDRDGWGDALEEDEGCGFYYRRRSKFQFMEHTKKGSRNGTTHLEATRWRR